MKYGIIIAFWLVFYGCRSSKHSNVEYSDSIQTHKENSIARTDSARTETVYKDSTTTAVDVLEYSRTTTFGDDGRISNLQEQWRRTGSSGVSVSTGRTSEVSVTEEKIDSTSTISEQKHEITEVKQTTDSRLIQGSEWLIVISLAISAICLFIAFILYKKNKK